ncbi:hypothetical protein AB0G85_21965 [Streptomyces sioyaensis]|uniref:hypothetical protein n=1 Tax=Streptomyces sioyaensis TaxID=67364 RepID=UPI0033EF7975
MLLLPPLVAAALNMIDDRLRYWQWRGLRNRLQKTLNKTTDPDSRRLLQAEIHKADLELAKILVESMRGIHAEKAES